MVRLFLRRMAAALVFKQLFFTVVNPKAGTLAACATFAAGFVASPGRHEVRVRALDEAGNVQPDAVGWNDLGYLYEGLVGHPIECS